MEALDVDPTLGLKCSTRAYMALGTSLAPGLRLHAYAKRVFNVSPAPRLEYAAQAYRALGACLMPEPRGVRCGPSA
jgi:hypothetical protein